MSSTFRERRNPPSRRKSCSACIKAKRRCDGASPVCLRCSHRGISCDYPLRKTRRTKHDRDSPPRDLQQDELVHSLDFLDETPTDMSASLLADVDESLDCSAPSLEFCLDSTALSQELAHQTMTVLPPSLTPYPPLGTTAAEIFTRQLQFALDETQRAPVTMAKELQTPWSHPMLYQDSMPKTIRDAHACCALYSIKNRFNGPAILHSVESYVDELLRSDPAPTLQDRLAHTQALILYHIIRLLDGDIRARASAESQLITLEESACALLPYIDFDDSVSKHEILPLYPVAQAKAFWLDWILHESARRTFLFSLYFLQAYRIVSGLQPPHCDSRLQLCRSLTVSTQMWNARSAVTLAKAWNQRSFFIVTNCSFDALLRDGKAEDIDAFTKMLMSSAMGIEEAEGWFAMRGSSLRDTRAYDY